MLRPADISWDPFPEEEEGSRLQGERTWWPWDIKYDGDYGVGEPLSISEFDLDDQPDLDPYEAESLLDESEAAPLRPSLRPYGSGVFDPLDSYVGRGTYAEFLSQQAEEVKTLLERASLGDRTAVAKLRERGVSTPEQPQRVEGKRQPTVAARRAGFRAVLTDRYDELLVYAVQHTPFIDVCAWLQSEGFDVTYGIVGQRGWSHYLKAVQRTIYERRHSTTA